MAEFTAELTAAQAEARWPKLTPPAPPEGVGEARLEEEEDDEEEE